MTAVLWSLVVAGLVGAAGGGCRVDQQKFEDRVFACDISAPDPGCGTDSAGKPMACFAARQIGATDFCAKTCDAAQPAPAGAVCLESDIALASCDPTVSKSCGDSGLACFRTDLLTDEGVCTTMNPCNGDTDCEDPVRSVCATTFLADIYPQGTNLKRDHLFCLQTGCKARGTSCSPGETCLQEVIPSGANPPDICVPNCDSMMRCPPNFLCYRKVSTAIAPNVCIPGLLGFTCETKNDCMLGDCVANDIGYSVCTAPCTDDADCERYDGIEGKFMCVKNPSKPSEPGTCQTPDAYRGSICDTTANCQQRNANEVCTRFNPTDATGTCLLPCAADGRCAPRVGINHTCLPVPDGSHVCFPGYFGYPCAGDDNCVGDLLCHPTVSPQPSICSTTCTSDNDCAADRWIGGSGWCATALGICLSRIADGKPCPSDTACSSGHCIGATDGQGNPTMVCASSTGGT